MSGHVAWYAHHHGRGHVTRAAAVIPHLRRAATVFTSAPTSGLGLSDVVELPPDLPGDGEPAAPPPPPGLHYAPLHCRGLSERMRILADHFARHRPDVLVVDVSVEVALLARLCGVPVAVVRQHGRREDLPHRLAYAWAEGLLAPFPEWLEDPATPGDVRDRTRYGPGFTARPPADASPVPGRIVVLGGAGGGDFAPDDVTAAARACPGTEWLVAGGATWRADPSELIASADVVVAHGGHNAVMEVAAAGRPLVCIPLERPFDEQHAKARALQRAGVAVVREQWPAPGEWPAVLDEARALGGEGLRRAVDGEGARQFAANVDALADAAASTPGGGDLGGGRLAEDLEDLAVGVPAHEPEFLQP